MPDRPRQNPAPPEWDGDDEPATVWATAPAPGASPMGRPDLDAPAPSSERTMMLQEPLRPPLRSAPVPVPVPAPAPTSPMYGRTMPTPGRVSVPDSSLPPPRPPHPSVYPGASVPPPARAPMHSAPPTAGQPWMPPTPLTPPTPMGQPGGFRPPTPSIVSEQLRLALRGKPDPRLVLLTDPDSARATSFRVLRDNLLAKRLPRVLAVSSAMAKDGKTTCAVNLALSLSEGARVLLLDGNLFEPSLATIFGIDETTPPSQMNGPWCAPYRIAELSATLHVATIALPPGATPPRFEKRWFEPLLASLRRTPYDFIIVDTPALPRSPTVSQLVAMADGTLLAVRSGATTARALRRAVEQIPEGKALGAALIDTKPTS